jgi:signal recognition particle GTPase
MQSFNQLYDEWVPFNTLDIISRTIHPEFCMDFDSISESENTQVDSEISELDYEDEDTIDSEDEDTIESDVEDTIDSDVEDTIDSDVEDTIDSDVETVVPEYNYEENEGSCSESETSNYKRPRIVSLEGNIGAGKSTLIEKLKKKYNGNPKILFLPEPVNIWEKKSSHIHMMMWL